MASIPVAMLRAAWQVVRHGRVVSGGSTITMQVARLLEPRPERTLGAKLAEMIRAVQLENRLSKDEILALYLALAPYGGNLEGTRAASLAYFGKEPRRLSAAEAAMLVALPQAPESRRPDRFPRAARAARDRVLDAPGAARASSTRIRRQRRRLEPAPSGAQALPDARRPCGRAPGQAQSRSACENQSCRDDDDFARRCRSSSSTWPATGRQSLGGGVSVAIIAVDNATGEVRAHVGGVGYFDKARAGQIDLAQALRSPGSTLKPFIYGLAFEDGLAHPETLVDDRPIRFGLYKPENFDEAFQGTVTMRRALQQSLNVPAVMLLNALGPNRLIARMKNAGAAPQLPRRCSARPCRRSRRRRREAHRSGDALSRFGARRRGRAARLASAGSRPCRAAAPPVRQGGRLAGRRCAASTRRRR